MIEHVRTKKAVLKLITSIEHTINDLSEDA